jgi:UDP-4-amino-4,6-dideoxy-N-acetyl-beta-L-altrosamine transaminase
MIPYGRHDVTEDDIEAVLRALRSDFLTQGPVVPLFEEAIAARVGGEYAVAVNSATSALHLACLALDVSPGDLVWTVPNTFVASANCARYCGADVGFVDIENDTWNMCPIDLERRLLAARSVGRLPKVVIPVHFAGQPADMPRIAELAVEFGFRIIEDASHAIGASIQGIPVGSGTWSAITVFSFHPVKILTTGEGGMAVTQDPTLASRMRRLRSHGITRDSTEFSQPQRGSWHYEQQGLGFNYRLTDIQAALGLSQLERLDAYVERRNRLAARYAAALEEMAVAKPVVRAGLLSAFHLFVVRIPANARRSRDSVFGLMRDQGVGVNVHYAPVHLQPYYRALGFGPGECVEAEQYGEEALTLPLYPTLTEAEQDRVIAALGSAL